VTPIASNSDTNNRARSFCFGVEGVVSDAGSDWVSMVTYLKKRSVTVYVSIELIFILSNMSLKFLILRKQYNITPKL